MQVEINVQTMNMERVQGELRALRLSYADIHNAIQDVFAITRRMGLPEDAQELLNYIQRMIAMANSLLISMIALQAASGPVGWVLAGLGVAASLVYATDMVGSYG